MPTTNPLTEVGTIVLAALLAIGGILLLYVGKIDIAFASSMFILAAGLLGFTGALKAPSPAQQQQISTQQQQIGAQQAQIGQLAQNQQHLTSQVLSALPAVVSATQSQPSPQPVGQVPLSELNLRPGQAVEVRPAQPSQPVPPMPVAPQAADSPFLARSPQVQQFKAGNTFEQPIVPRG